MTSTREPLVSEDRLSRAWEVITSRVPGLLDAAAPDAYVQPSTLKTLADGRQVHTNEIAVFAIAEPNPRYLDRFGDPSHLQISVTHMPLAGWQEMERDAQHYVAKGFDPLVWCLFQAVKGHLQVMDNIRAMSHPVTRVNERGETELSYPTGGQH